jgi:signal transduction histidine kinase
MRSTRPRERRVPTMSANAMPAPIPAPPWEQLRATLLAHADDMAAAGDGAAGASLRAIVEAWWEEQRQWNGEAARTLALHHEINNALVGVSGNAQLLLMGPAGQQPGVRERLEVVLRESQRIRDAAVRIRWLRAALHADGEPVAEPAARRMAGGER